jgi:glycosyltransferase involved in cell wall biosynthesis
MRIVFLSYHYSPDIRSPEEWLERIAYYRGWAECLGKKHNIIRVDQINFEGEFSYNDIQYYCIDDGKRKNFFPAKLHRYVKDLNPEVIVVSSFQYPLQILQLRLCLGNKTRIILQHHAEKPFTGLKKYLQYLTTGIADAFLFTSLETGAAWVKSKNLPADKKIYELQEVSSSFQPIDQKTAGKLTGISGSPVFLWVGRLNKNKDPLMAVRAFLKFTELNPSAKMYMIYQSKELLEEIKKLLPKKKEESPVSLIGNIPHSELPNWYSSSDFYISASHYEGSGTALCEAMSCGCIPLVSNIPPFRKISGTCALFFEPGNEKSLVSTLIESGRLKIDEEKIRVLSYFKGNLSFPAIAAKFEKIIDAL